MIDMKDMKCPVCGHRTEVKETVRRKYCRLCGRLMEVRE